MGWNKADIRSRSLSLQGQKNFDEIDWSKKSVEPTLIQDWSELAQVPESATHCLDIDVHAGNGWIKKKGNEDSLGYYLSTHTFYGSKHEHSTRLLRECGFNVTIANWDAPRE